MFERCPGLDGLVKLELFLVDEDMDLMVIHV
jgi:hypothetical protein